MKNGKLTLVALAVSASLGVSTATQAMPIAVDIALEAQADVAANGDAAADSSRDPAYAVASVAAGAEQTSTSYANSRGMNNGWFYLTAEGAGINFNAMSSFTQAATVSNTSAFAQTIDFDFTVNFGGLSIDFLMPEFIHAEEIIPAQSPQFGQGEWVSSAYSAQILLNNSVLWSSEATLRYDENGFSFTQNGEALGTYTTGNNEYTWIEQNDSLALGTLNAGQQFVLEYVVNVTSTGNTPVVTIPDCEGGYGEHAAFFAAEVAMECDFPSARAYSQFGDPNGLQTSFTADSFTATQVNPNPVPAPAPVALLGAGLAGLAFMRRKNANK